MEHNISLQVELKSSQLHIAAAEDGLKRAQCEHEIAIEEFQSRQRAEIETVRFEGQRSLDALKAQHDSELGELRRRLEHELEDERSARAREIQQHQSQITVDSLASQAKLGETERKLAAAQDDLQALRTELERERKNTNNLRQNLDTASSNSVTLESTISALKARIEFLESGREEQSEAFERLNQQMMDAAAETNAAKEKLRREETLRRKLHNQVQELKGNIRVFCRVRPTLPVEGPSDAAHYTYPDEAEDSKEINILGPEEKSSLGAVTRKNHNFSFDHVFGPSAQNSNVFDEISQLVQSALDGYNVCIFCYGQTGSGKTHTMSSLDGMIPKAVHQIYETATSLEEKGWRYKMEGNFVEVYNENLNDLLGKAEELDKKKLEIRHDMQRGKTIITDVTTVQLESPEMVESLLKRAAANRSVAATKANERSSRSHSVFILKLIGENYITGERSEGTLNLVDLAGSERLSHSGATGDRLRETQNINRSLSCLGDVIAALGQGKEGGHIPYRNSKVCTVDSSLTTRLTSPTVDISSPILAGWKLQDTHVCHGQPTASTSLRELDKSQVCYQGAQHPHWYSEAPNPCPRRLISVFCHSILLLLFCLAAMTLASFRSVLPVRDELGVLASDVHLPPPYSPRLLPLPLASSLWILIPR